MLEEQAREAIAKEVEASSAIAQLTKQVTKLESARVLAEDCVATLEVSFEAERQNAVHELAIDALTAKFNAKLCMVQLERVTGECTALTSDLANCKEDNVMIRVKKAESDLSEKNQELCNAMEEITSLKNSLVSESCQKAVQDKLLSNTQSFLETVIGELVLESQAVALWAEFDRQTKTEGALESLQEEGIKQKELQAPAEKAESELIETNQKAALLEKLI